MSDPTLNLPTLVKRMPICKAVGEFVNGDQAGTIDLALFKSLIANQKKYPRQIPVYLITGSPTPDHPNDLDAMLADGWVENLAIDGDQLMGDVKLHGQAAVAVANDMVRGASIGTVLGKTPAGASLGQVLEHVVLTNSPFVKGMNIAAARVKGGEPVAYHFTALHTEATMADEPTKKPDDGGGVNLTEKVTALEVLLTEKDAAIRELTASRDNLIAEVKAFRESPSMELAQKEIAQLKRHNLAEKVRRITANMLRDRQINTEALRGWCDHDSDEVVLTGFTNSQFKGSLDLLQYHRDSVPKNPGRSFASGTPADGEMTLADKETARAAGKDPEKFAKTRGASNFTDWKSRRAAAGGKE